MIGGRATFIAAPLTTTRKALSITVPVTHHLYAALSGVIIRRRGSAVTRAPSGEVMVGAAVRKNTIWSLYSKRQMYLFLFLSNDR
jgi:hypothetical protein